MEKIIITISREFGSGGKELGKKLSEELGIAFYDSEIIDLLVKETGLSEEYISKTSESAINNPITNYARFFAITSNIYNKKTELLVLQQKIIKDIANKESCIIVGRGADIILKEYNPFKIFVYSDLESKVKRCIAKANEKEKLSEKEIIRNIKEIDKNRKKYYDIISNNIWGEKENYNLCINTTNKEIKKIVKPLAAYIKLYFEKGN